MEKINSCKFCRNVDRAAVALIIPEDSERKHNPKLWYRRDGTADKDGFDQTLYGCHTDRIEIDYSENVPILMCQTSDGEYEDLGTPIKYCPFCGRKLTNGKDL